jgi:hypothetical protein
MLPLAIGSIAANPIHPLDGASFQPKNSNPFSKPFAGNFAQG